MNIEKTLASIISNWNDDGGYLYRLDGDCRWRHSYDLAAFCRDAIGVDFMQVASFDGIEDDDEMRDAADEAGITLEIVEIQPITLADIDDAPVSRSENSHYLDVWGYRFRASDHCPMTDRSAFGLVTWIRVESDADADETEDVLRQRAIQWLEEMNATIEG